MSEIAINLIPLRPGVPAEDFARFSAELDRPTLLAQDVVEGFDVYAVDRRSDGAPAFDVVEVMQVRSWSEWEGVRDGLPALEPVVARFEQLIDPTTVRTLFGARIEPRS